ncbi:MAG: DUF1249 domain-containing protein [Gammaproteobacteria bacterium]|nr:DUF1249 domain-containing protein [Gammaproteobacteria bacterium]
MNHYKYKVGVGYGCEDVDPCGFVSLMDLYENNYLRLRRLIPDLAQLPEHSVSCLPGCLNLHLNILQQTEFTSTVFLSYYFNEDELAVAEPALTVRIYHDANQVEVLTGHLQHGRQRYDHLSKKALKTKWKLNRFLFKWLGYCLYLGHSFPLSDQSLSVNHAKKPLVTQ